MKRLSARATILFSRKSNMTSVTRFASVLWFIYLSAHARGQECLELISVSGSKLELGMTEASKVRRKG